MYLGYTLKNFLGYLGSNKKIERMPLSFNCKVGSTCCPIIKQFFKYALKYKRYTF